MVYTGSENTGIRTYEFLSEPVMSLHFTLYTLQFTFYSLCFTVYVIQFIQFTFYSLHFTLAVSCQNRHWPLESVNFSSDHFLMYKKERSFVYHG